MLRVVLAGFVLLLPLAMWSGYRAIVQVFSLDVAVHRTADGQGTAMIDVIGSGRATLTVTTEIIAGSAHDTVQTDIVHTHRDAALDPRPIRGRFAVRLPALPTSSTGDKFSPGATLRVTAVGRSQWLRTPPPTIRDVAIGTPSGAAHANRMRTQPRPP